MQVVKWEHNTRDKILIQTEKHKYSVVIGSNMQGQMTGVFFLYQIDEANNPICISNGQIDASLFVPTDEKAMIAIEEQVLGIIESYESD